MLERYRREIYSCNRCGICRAKYSKGVYYVCPVREHSGGFEPYFGRGRVQVAKGILEGAIGYSDALAEVVYTCLGCESCRQQCGAVEMATGKPLIDPALISRAMREEFVEKEMEPQPLREIDSKVSTDKGLWGHLLESKKKFQERFDLPKKGEFLYFSGCYALKDGKEGEIIIRILQKLGKEVAYLAEAEWCCGMIQYWNGNTRLAREMAQHNMESLAATEAQRVITSCAGCYHTLKDIYPQLMERELPFRVQHLSEYLSELLDEGRVRFEKEISKRVTYHDPCRLGRHSGMYDPPRKVIQAIPGIIFGEMERIREGAFCCGSGIGIVRTCHPDLALSIAQDRIREAELSGAQILVSACPMCIEQLKEAGEKAGTKLECLGLSNLVGDALSIK